MHGWSYSFRLKIQLNQATIKWIKYHSFVNGQCIYVCLLLYLCHREDLLLLFLLLGGIRSQVPNHYSSLKQNSLVFLRYLYSCHFILTSPTHPESILVLSRINPHRLMQSDLLANHFVTSDMRCHFYHTHSHSELGEVLDFSLMYTDMDTLPHSSFRNTMICKAFAVCVTLSSSHAFFSWHFYATELYTQMTHPFASQVLALELSLLLLHKIPSTL